MNSTKNANDIIHFHKWTSDTPILGEVFSTVVFEDGGQQHCKIGQIEIQKDDFLYLNYGAERQVYTRSGRGYESEYPYGRITLHGCPIGVTLTLEESQNVKQSSSTRAEFEAQVASQKQRIEPFVNKLVSQYVEAENIRRKERVEAQAKAKVQREKMISDALEKMDQFFNRNRVQDNKEISNNSPTSTNKNKPR
jgi:hypothetical protein